VAATDDERAIPLREEIARVVLDVLAPPPTDAVATDPTPVLDDLSAYAGLWRGVNRVESNVEKAFSLPQQGRVGTDPDGSLRITSFGGAISERLTPVARDLFRGSDGGFYAFRRDAAGNPDALTISGEVSDPLTLRRGRPFEDARLHLGIVGFFGVAVLTCPLVGLSRRFRRSGARDSGPARAASRLHALAAAIAVLGPLVVLGGFFVNRPPYDGLPAQVVVGLVLLHALALLTVAQAYCAVRAWRAGWWGRVYRTYYSLASVAGLAFTGFLLYWNLLGLRL